LWLRAKRALASSKAQYGPLVHLLKMKQQLTQKGNMKQ